MPTTDHDDGIRGYRIEEALSEHLKAELARLFREESRHLLDEYRRLKPLLSLKDVATTLGVSPRTVETMLAAGELPPPLWISGQRRWHPDTLAAYIRSREEVRR